MRLIAPPFCVVCKQWLADYNIFCLACGAKVKPITSHSLMITKNKSVKVIAISRYQDPLKSLILAKGSSNIIASAQLGTLIWQLTTIKGVSFDCIVPVPLHWTRYAWRGYNQAHEIAKVIARYSGKPIVKVSRRKRTKVQSLFNREERIKNVEQVFYAQHQSGLVGNKHILLVDDVMTTGATIHALAKEVYRYKPLQVTAVVACRV